jgi:primosomal protein N' (replication factor Y)
VIGPAPCFFARYRGHFRWQVILRAADPVPLVRGLALGPAWRVDIDPMSLL